MRPEGTFHFVNWCKPEKKAGLYADGSSATCKNIILNI